MSGKIRLEEADWFRFKTLDEFRDRYEWLAKRIKERRDVHGRDAPEPDRTERREENFSRD